MNTHMAIAGSGRVGSASGEKIGGEGSDPGGWSELGLARGGNLGTGWLTRPRGGRKRVMLPACACSVCLEWRLGRGLRILPARPVCQHGLGFF
jgi:hypothetical protein